MKIVIQRSANSSVEVDGKIKASISKGLLLLVCLEKGDTEETLAEASEKISKLRIFEDDKGKMNLNLLDAGGEVLSISQFTLSWDGKKGHRPSFDASMEPRQARLMYEIFNKKLRELGLKVETGVFGADMKVSSVNDGPVTFYLSF